MKNIKFTFSREKFFSGFDGEYCKIYPNICLVSKDVAFLSYTMLKLSGSDTVHDAYCAKSADGGKTFEQPKLMKSFQIYENGIRKNFAQSVTLFHKKTGKFMTLGCNFYYDKEEKHPIMNEYGITYTDPCYVFRDVDSGDYKGEPKAIELPFKAFAFCPFGQPIEYENGDIHLTFYGAKEGEKIDSIYPVLMSFDGDELKIKKIGQAIKGVSSRGYAEPSVAKLGDKYYMTLRSDEVGLFAESDNGFEFSEPKPWVWDDGSVLENYNTQQRWVRYKGGLYLAYTRKGAHNDHVFRHRAPIFMTRFDEDKKCLIRSEEVILVPELGARLGNFTVTDVSENEFWVMTAEWMQTWAPYESDWRRCAQYGSDNSIWRAKVIFEK